MARNGCLRNLSLWFRCAFQVAGKLIFKSVVGKQHSTLIYPVRPPSQLWQTETWQLRSCQLESYSQPLLWMNTSHCQGWRDCVSWSFGKDSFFLIFLYPFLLKCTFWHQPYVQPASLSTETSHLNSMWEVFSEGNGASVGKEPECRVEMMCWRRQVTYLREQLYRNFLCRVLGERSCVHLRVQSNSRLCWLGLEVC